MRASEIMENQGPVHDMLLKLRKGAAASLNATKLAEIFKVLPGWSIEKMKSYKLSDGGWVLAEVGNGAAKQFNTSFINRNSTRIRCSTAMPRSLDRYNGAGDEARQKSYRDEAVRKSNELKSLGEKLTAIQNAPEKGKWFIRNVEMGEEQGQYGDDLVVSFDFYVQTSGFRITSPDGQTYEVFGDYKNGAHGPQTFASWFASAVENTEIMDQILEVLGMEPHEKKHDPKSRYSPPAGSPKETQEIFEVLQRITQSVRERQKEAFITRDKRAVMDFVEALKSGDKQTMRRLGESQYGFIISRSVDTRKRELLSDWETTIDRYAEDAVEAMQNQFVYKNTKKLASIATAKGGMKEPKVARVGIDSGVLVATLQFEFDDGSNFRVDQTVVISTSVRGTPFYRFPTTFHDVVLPDGSRMGMPSEERMNEVFANA